MQGTSSAPPSNPATPQRWTLSDLPFAARITIASFLLAVGVGYLGALVNMHFAEATPGEVLPSKDDLIRSYGTSKTKMSHFERLLVAHPSLPFNGSGSMRRVLTSERASGRNKELKRIAKANKLSLDDPAQERQVQAIFQKELDGERLSLIAWARLGFDKTVYEEDAFKRPDTLASHPIAPGFLTQNGDVRIAAILQARCVSCHSTDVGGPAARYPLETYEDITHYSQPETAGKSLAKLALTTHVHLLGFSMLYILTGLALALSSCPAWIRIPISPLALLASVADVACWWLARLEEPYGPQFAQGIAIAGSVVAGALLLQIVLTSFSLFRVFGKLVLLLLFLAAGTGAYYAKDRIIDPHLKQEKEMLESTQGTPPEKALKVQAD